MHGFRWAEGGARRSTHRRGARGRVEAGHTQRSDDARNDAVRDLLAVLGIRLAVLEVAALLVAHDAVKQQRREEERV